MKITLAKPIQITNQALTRQTPAFAASECSFWSLSMMLIKIFLILQVLIVKTLLIVATTTLWAPWTLYFTNKQKWDGATSYHGQTYIIPVNTPVFPGSLPYFIHLPPPLPFCYFSRETPIVCMGPDLVIWILESIFYSKVFQLPDLVWNALPHTIDTIHKFQTICDPNLATCNARCWFLCR